MAVTSDQIQADIARTRAGMSASLPGSSPGGQSTLGSVTSSISEQVRKRPLAALGLSLVAGSLLQGVVSGGSGSVTGSSSTGIKEKASSATDTATSTLSQAGSSAAGAASSATDTVTSTAQSAGETVTSAAQQAASVTSDVAGGVVETTSDMASQVASTAGGAVNQVAETTGTVASTASQQVSTATSSLSNSVRNLGTTTSQQVQQHPLTALSIATGVGIFAQPAVAPQVAKITGSVRQQASQLQQSFSAPSAQSAVAPNQEEVNRITQALVPATVEKTRQFVSRDLRDMLEKNLEPVVGQTSLRAGVVAAVTEKAEDFAQSRLPDILNRNLSGTRGLLIAAIVAKVLKARNEVQQGQGQTMTNITSGLTQSATQSTTEDLQRYFPEFRQQYQQTSS